MNKLGKVILAGCLIAGVSFAQTNEVVSKNAVGYVKISLTADQFKIISMPFNMVDGSSITVGEALGDMPDSTVVYIFNGISYNSEQYLTGPGWLPGTNVITRGQSFWVKSPSDKDVFLMGEVPDSGDAQTSITLQTGYQLISYPYPTDIDLMNTAISSNAVDSDQIFVFNGSSYVPYNYLAGAGWLPDSFTIQPGVGFWYHRIGTPVTVNELKPYTWP